MRTFTRGLRPPDVEEIRLSLWGRLAACRRLLIGVPVSCTSPSCPTRRHSRRHRTLPRGEERAPVADRRAGFQPAPQNSSQAAKVLRLAVVYAACAFAAQAQTSRGTVTGTVLDPTGAVIGGAHVTLTGVERASGSPPKATRPESIASTPWISASTTPGRPSGISDVISAAESTWRRIASPPSIPDWKWARRKPESK